jgi:hypothetical protein
MENSHCREIHYHLAQALMHMKYIAGYLLSLNHPSIGTTNLKTTMVVPTGHTHILVISTP